MTPAGKDPPTPFTAAAPPGSLRNDTVLIHGVPITYAYRAADHKGLVRSHIRRELNGYALLKDAIASSRARAEKAAGDGGAALPPLVMDVGANHGLFALFAASLGAQVVVLEPQRALCEVINAAAALNGAAVAGRITLYNYAALDAREFIDMSAADVAEGAVATVVRGKEESGAQKPKKGAVEARPVSDFAPAGTRPICFLKIDVEGFELHAIASSYPLFGVPPAADGTGGVFARVEHVVVEFGPPSRWRVADNTVADGAAVLRTMEETYGFENRLIDSLVWNDYSRKYAGSALPRSTTDFGENQHVLKEYVSLRGAEQASHLLKAMAAQGEGASCCEAYVWFVRGPAAAGGEEEAAALATLGRECPTRVRSGVYGCETP